ncbi:hypothetical protein CIT292_11277 [Citrobacter youngae ATCC 29220]|uniref:Uncharacterized protein n=1 Tax=Citrobacter youngae ATCC 29220 TaxID=500640 RepID=D4BL37_9ENTR|nr:hypothetical protein CIT292_11277 [Citrobacter youngae ATCC 29220]
MAALILRYPLNSLKPYQKLTSIFIKRPSGIFQQNKFHQALMSAFSVLLLILLAINVRI